MSHIRPEFRTGGGHSAGGTGHWPVPCGDPAGSAPELFRTKPCDKWPRAFALARSPGRVTDQMPSLSRVIWAETDVVELASSNSAICCCNNNRGICHDTQWEAASIPNVSRTGKTPGSRVSMWSAVSSAPLSCVPGLSCVRSRVVRTKAAVNAPHSRRFAHNKGHSYSREASWSARDRWRFRPRGTATSQ